MATTSHYSSAAPKVERRIIEKNRRNHMKSLYSKLYSLLPNHGSQEAVTLPDQIDEAVKYIQSLQKKLEKSKQKKEALLSKKRSHKRTNEFILASKPPRIDIREMGFALDVVLICGQDDKFIFYEIIRIIHEEGAEVVNASSSVHNDTILHVLHANLGEFAPKFVAARVSNRLREFVNGSISDMESQTESWEFEIQPDVLELELPQVLHMGVFNEPCTNDRRSFKSLT